MRLRNGQRSSSKSFYFFSPYNTTPDATAATVVVVEPMVQAATTNDSWQRCATQVPAATLCYLSSTRVCMKFIGLNQNRLWLIFYLIFVVVFFAYIRCTEKFFFVCASQRLNYECCTSCIFRDGIPCDAAVAFLVIMSWLVPMVLLRDVLLPCVVWCWVVWFDQKKKN